MNKTGMILLLTIIVWFVGWNSRHVVLADVYVPDADMGVIAYAGLDGNGRAVSIKTIRPDGSNSRTLYTLKDVGEITDVAWAPDAREVGFISSEEAAYSIFNQDVFGIKPDGTGLRRISNPPRFVGLPNGQQTGVIQGVLRNNSGRSNVSVIALYIQGATGAAQGTFVNNLDTINFSLTVTDLGVGTMQYIAISWADGFGGPYKEFILPGIDIQPGQTTNIGIVDFVGMTNQPTISDLSWNHNGTVVGTVLENGSAVPWQFNSAGEVAGKMLVTNLNLVSTLALSPIDDQLVYYDSQGAAGVIYLNQAGGDSSTQQEILYDAVSSLNYDRHIAWLPDGSGLVVSVNGHIYDYLFATQQVRQLTNFGGVAQIDRVSVSPNGRTIAFSYSEMPGVSNLYLLDRQTLAINQLTSDGRSAFPSWSRVNPPETQFLFLPFIVK